MSYSQTNTSAHQFGSKSVPAVEAELTPEWLRSSGVARQLELGDATFTTQRIGADYGLASEIFRLRWQDDLPIRSVVAKLWPTNSSAGETEVHFYRTVGRQLGIRVPACFDAAVDPERQRGILVLEDLEDVVQGDVLEQAGMEKAEAIARTLAVMHVRWMNDPALFNNDWLQSVAVWDPGEDWFASRRALFLRRFGDRLSEPGRMLLDRVARFQEVANARLANARQTLLHAELHLDNIVFESDAQPVLLDWAKCARGPLAVDLYELLFAIGRLEDVERTLQAYLDTYELESGEALDVDRLRHELGGVFLRRFAIGTCGIARWETHTAREVAMIDASLKRLSQALQYWHEYDQGLLAFPR